MYFQTKKFLIKKSIYLKILQIYSFFSLFLQHKYIIKTITTKTMKHINKTFILLFSHIALKLNSFDLALKSSEDDFI